jgi:hypothetical protein
MEWKDDPRVSMVPRVSYDTVLIAVRYVPVPATGAVSAGSGTVWENPTRGLPVLNPTLHTTALAKQLPPKTIITANHG